jgi:hypothetical protein
MRSSPERGDLIIRNRLTETFDVVDAETGRLIAGPFASFAIAIDAAKDRRPGRVWQQSFDQRGRALGDPVRVCGYEAS